MINASDLDFSLLAFSTKSKILDTVESPNAFVVLTKIVLVKFTVPLITELPTITSCGKDSPVKALVSSVESPLIMIPSRGIFSPGLI